MDLKRITAALVKDLAPLRFGAPVTHVYNPLEYAAASYGQYLERYGQGSRKVVMFGMNPGPWGMAQTGVPFGDIAMVKDWLGIDAPIGKPTHEHPKRPIQGFACPRSEVSGSRLWGWARDRFRTPQRFFKQFFIANYCPLVFMEDTGRNRTPDKLPVAESKPLQEACDRALLRTIQHFQPDMVIGVGKFAEDRARSALADLDVKIGRILHPSPASPAANRGWAGAATAQLENYGLPVN